LNKEPRNTAGFFFGATKIHSCNRVQHINVKIPESRRSDRWAGTIIFRFFTVDSNSGS
jgi:hypothetical protein